MTMKRPFNWRLWAGLLLAFVAPVSYFFFFASYAITRDVPWTAFLLIAIALVLLVAGWRRAPRKLVPSLVAALALFLIGSFTYLVTIGSKNLPLSAKAPALGAKAPEFTLADANGRPVSLSSLLSGSNGVLLVFYRGYW